MKWATLPQINPRYKVSDTGAVNSAGRLLKQQVSNGYLHVQLYVPKVGRKWFYVHRLVLLAFTGREGTEANHKDGVRSNNALSNLEWVSRSENMQHAYKVLQRKGRGAIGATGDKCPRSKAVAQYTLTGVLVKIWAAQMEAQRAGFNQGKVSAVCRGDLPQHKGFVWSFV